MLEASVRRTRSCFALGLRNANFSTVFSPCPHPMRAASQELSQSGEPQERQEKRKGTSLRKMRRCEYTLSSQILQCIDSLHHKDPDADIPLGLWQLSTQVGRRAAAPSIAEADLHARRAPTGPHSAKSEADVETEVGLGRISRDFGRRPRHGKTRRLGPASEILHCRRLWGIVEPATRVQTASAMRGAGNIMVWLRSWLSANTF